MYRSIVIVISLLYSQIGIANEYLPSRDLISLHYDFAPDRDDGHASAAARSLIGKYNEIEFIVITGAVGTNANRHVDEAAALQDRIWGAGNHLNAYENWERSVDTTARYWGGTIEQGGYVFVAEGGQSDFTADVVKRMIEYDVDRLSKQSVTVIQHSRWNENHTSREALQFVKENTRYIKIPDGNVVNQTADLNRQSSNFVAWAKSGVFSESWEAAFSFLDPEAGKLDFSDTVELLYILGISKDKVYDPESFGEFLEGSENTGVENVQTTSSSAEAADAIVIEAESFVEADDDWIVQGNRDGSSGGASVKLLPDTRVTHSDPLIPGVNFWGSGGEGPYLVYAVNIPQAGEYVVSVRAYSTGTEDNSIHVGVNGEFPESGARMQWCSGKNQWTWSSAQRTNANHCGVQGSITLNIESAGINEIVFSAREDGFEFDAFRLQLIRENGTVLSAQDIESMSSRPYQIALRQQMKGRVDAVGAAFDECGNLSGSVLSDCTKAALVNYKENELSAVVLVHQGSGEGCTATGDTLRKARGQYAQQCAMPVHDCDPMGGGWTCSSIQIGKASPSYSRNRNPVQQNSDYVANNTATTTGSASVDHCVVANPAEYSAATGACISVGGSQSEAKALHRRSCSAEYVDCESIGGAWMCSTVNIPDGSVSYNCASGPNIDDEIYTAGGNVAQTEIDNSQADSGSVSNVKTRWSDSYAVGGQCYCDSNFDHGIGDEMIQTPAGAKTMREVCAAVAAKHGQGGRERVYYNTIQCGHVPINGFYDEAQCPGYPANELNYTGPDCDASGPTFNLDSLYAADTGEEPVDYVDHGNWWQPQGSQNLTWYMQFQGTLNLNHEVDVYFLDGDIDKTVVDRLKAQGKKVMCYISAGSSENWRSDFSQFPESVKGNDYYGWPGERWLDINNKAIVYPIMEARLDACKAKGFDGIDADNVNSHVNNTGFDISRSDAITFVKWLANESHQRGMAYSLKNAEDIASAVVDHVDMLQSESCFVYNNCSAAKSIRNANKPVWMVEYASITRDWDAACEAAKNNGFSAILRDVLLTGTGEYRQCL